MARRVTDRSLTIGAVLAQVRAEFPDVTISKIRFLETEGLLHPTRTPSGYRTFDEGQVERLRYILRAQRDQFWPLKVIRESLDALDRGLQPATESDLRPRPPAPTDDPDVSLEVAPGVASARVVRLTLGELAAACGLPTSAIADIEAHGLIHPDLTGHYDGHALRVVTAVAGLSAHGLEPRHLRPFRTAADREIGLVHQASAGRAPTGESDVTAEVARLCLQLHAALLKAGLAAT